MKRLNDLPTALVWKIFQEISKIPRASGNERNVAEWIANYAQKKGIEAQIDETGNVILKKEATKGLENRPTLAFQGHMDMVAVKTSDSQHDFEKDPIIPYIMEIKGEQFVKAKDTTLGADDGIAVAMALAIMTDPEIEHGPLEALFTVGEEVSMVGINGVKAGVLDSKYMINIDSETDDEVTIGCAGGCDAEFHFNLEYENNEQDGIEIELTGFTGGHSGIEINKKRANGIQTLAILIREILSNAQVKLSSFNGGMFRNAIPHYASAILGGSKEELKKAHDAAEKLIKNIKEQYQATDPNIKLTIKPVSNVKTINSQSTSEIIATICEMPDGVLTMSSEFPEVVESSLNIGVISTKENEIITSSLLRSLVNTTPIENLLQAVADRHNYKVKFFNRYPGWEPSGNSKLLDCYSRIYEDFNFKKPKISVIHAGVECGILRGKYPSLDIISIGPNVIGAHTTEERVSVPSVEKIYGLILSVMDELTY